MSRYLKVEGHEGLLKDPFSGAVINDDLSAYEIAVQQKEKRIKELQRVNDLEDKVATLENLINKLLEAK